MLRILLLCLLPLSVMAEDPTELTLYTWTDYIDETVVKQFEQRFNAKLQLSHFESEDMRDKTMLRTKGKGYDVILLSGKDVETYQKRGWVVELDDTKVPNLKHVTPRWRDAWPQTKTHAVPYHWGTVGIIYRADLIKEDISSWNQLYRPKEYLKGKITLLDDRRAVIGIALKSLGYSFNSENKKELAEAQALLLSLKPDVQAFGYFSYDENASIVTGDVWMGQLWNGDALVLQELHDSIRYVVPKEGGEIWVDYFVVSKQSKVPELAMQFVNFIQEPKINALSAESLAYATTNVDAKQFLSDEHLNNAIIYPDETVLAHSEFKLTPKSARIKRKHVMIWSKLMN